jgi:hypothetical protein
MAHVTTFPSTPRAAALIGGRTERKLAALDRWQRLLQAICDPYRPELHYMRGPGPRWHEKHAALQRRDLRA